MNNTLLASALSLLFSSVAFAGPAPIPGTIPLSGTFCAQGQASNGYYGVQPGPCVAPPPPPGTCPTGRALRTSMCYSYGPSNCVTKDATKFENLFTGGRNNPPKAFPGAQGFVLLSAVKRNEYVAAQFTAPLSPLNQFGQMWTNETSSGPPTDFSISTSCGDFHPADNKCWRENVGRGSGAAAWKLPAFAGSAQCPLVPGASYYFNVKIHDPNVVHFECNTITCNIGIQSNHNP